MKWLCLCVLFSGTALAYTYRRPIPQLPVIKPLQEINSLFDYSIVNLLYSTLFVLDEKNVPVPFAVKDFKVSEGQKNYIFTLKEFYFHNGKRVEAGDVKKSLEEKLKQKAVNFEAFSHIVGFAPFMEGKASTLVGIKALDRERLQINLINPDPALPFKLTDVRFSVTANQQGQVLGSGPFRLHHQGPGPMVLEIFAKNQHLIAHSHIKRIELYEVDYQAAVAGFKAGKFDDLFFYVVSHQDQAGLSEFSHIKEIYFPRTYFAAVNARAIPSRADRQRIIDSIGVTELNRRCFNVQEATTSLVPKGFLGYGHHLKPSGALKPYRKKLKIYVTKTIGAEPCIQESFRKFFPEAAVSIEDLSKVLKDWEDNKIDILIAYIEAQSTLHYFGSFNPKLKFSYGDKSDKLYDVIYQRMEQAQGELEKNKAAAELATHILDLKTFLPLFHPNLTLIFSNKFQTFTTPFKSAALIPVYDLKLRNVP